MSEDASSTVVVDLREQSRPRPDRGSGELRDRLTALEPALTGLIARAADSDDPELRRRASVMARRTEAALSAARGASRERVAASTYLSMRDAVLSAVAGLPSELRRSVTIGATDGELSVHGELAAFVAGILSALEELASTAAAVTVELSEHAPGAHSATGPAVCLVMTAEGSRIPVDSAARVVAALHSCTPASECGPVAVRAGAGAVAISSDGIDLRASGEHCEVVAVWPLDVG